VERNHLSANLLVGDSMNTVQETTRQSLQEIGEHTRSMISDPKVLPYYVLAGGAIATSIGLYFAGRKHESLFFALWPPTILTMAILSRISRGFTERVLQ
jgi:hypothetical protein